jgi:hypothetical protein
MLFRSLFGGFRRKLGTLAFVRRPTRVGPATISAALEQPETRKEFV